MNSHIATEATRPRIRRSARSVAVLAVGPTVVLGGLLWALAQPYRITLLHPHGEGFWWLFVQPPLWVVVVGLVFHAFVTPGVVADLEETQA